MNGIEQVNKELLFTVSHKKRCRKEADDQMIL